MRTLNLRWLLGLIITSVVLGGVAHAVHGYQMTRIASAFLRQARRAQAEKRPTDALRDLRNYLTLRPDDIEGLVLFGQELADNGRTESALLTLERVLRRDPERADARRTVVNLAMQLGRRKDAVANIDYLLKNSPKDAELWHLKGVNQAAQMQYDAAKVSLATALASDVQKFESYGLLASLNYGPLKNPEEAAKIIDLMVDNNPEDVRAYLNRAQWKLQLLNSSLIPSSRETGLAVRQKMMLALSADAGRARELAPESADVLVLSARVAITNQAYEEARGYLQRGLRIHDKDPRFYLALADVEGDDSNPKAALAALQRGAESCPQDRELLWNLANRLIEQGSEAEMLAAIKQLKDAGAQPELVGFLDARLLIQQGHWLRAIRRLESLRPQLQEWPNLVKQSDILLARAYSETDSADQQLISLRRAVDLDPQWVPARILLAESLLSANMMRQATEEYRRIVALPGAPEKANVDLARCLLSSVARQTKNEQDWSEFDEVLAGIERRGLEKVRAAILRAEKLIVQGLNEEASKLISTVRAQNSDELDLWIAQISLSQMTRDWDEVEKLLQSAEEHLGANVTLRVMKGRYFAQRYGKEARPHLRSISELDPGWADSEKFVFLRNFTLLLLASGDYEKAAEIGQSGSQLRSGDLTMQLLLFDIAWRSENVELMNTVLQQVRDIAGESPIWHYGEAVRLTLNAAKSRDAESLSAARLHLTKAKLARSMWSRIPLLYADIDILQNDFYAATAHLQEAIRLGERSPSVLSRAVQLLFRQRRFNEADQIVRQLQERPNVFTGEMIRSASEISMRLNDATRALDLAEQLVRDSGDTADKVWLAQVLGALGRHEEAEQQLRAMIESDQTSPTCWVALVQVLARSNQEERARQVVIEAEKKIAADESAIAIGQCYELLGETEVARDKYDAALKLVPGNVAVLERIVELNLRSGRSSDSEQLLRNLLQEPNKLKVEEMRWARRKLAHGLAITEKPAQLAEAAVLIEQNLGPGITSPPDERVKALVLACRPSMLHRKEAIAILEKLKTFDTDASNDDRFLLAQLYLATGDRSKARTELRTLANQGKNNPFLIAAYLQFVIQDKNLGEADNWLTRLQEIEPNELRTVGFRTQLLFARGRYSDLIALLKETVGHHPSTGGDAAEASQSTHLWAAQQFDGFAVQLRDAKNNQLAAEFATEAASQYEQHVQKFPQDVLRIAEFRANNLAIDGALDLLERHGEASSLNRVVAVAAAVLNNPEASDAQLSRLQDLLLRCKRSIGSTNDELELALADLLSRSGKCEDAIVLYRSLLKADGQNIAALNNLALVLALSGGNTTDALKLLQSAIDAGGPVGTLLDTRGLICLAANDPGPALADFEASLREGESADRAFHLAIAYMQLRRKDAAARAYDRAIALHLSEKKLHPLERPWLAKLQESIKK